VLTGNSTSLSGVVVRSLDKSQSRRYQAVTDLLAELRNASGSASRTASQSDVTSIAVLPFANMSADPEQEYFCEGMAEEIINALTGLEGLHVSSRTSAFLAKAKNFDIAEIGTRLKVGAVLEGSVRKAGNRLRVTAQLINVSDGCHLWSERYDRDMDDVFAVQDEITEAVVGKLKVKLLGKKVSPVAKRPTDNLEAYNLFLKGRHHFERFTRPALEQSLECFSQALAVEPSYAQVHAGIADVQSHRAMLSFVAPQHVMPMAKEAALAALALDESVAEAHAALATVIDCYEWNWPDAEQEYRRALELNSSDPRIRSRYADLLSREGRADAAATEARRAVEQDPLSAYGRFHLALTLVSTRRFDAAMAEANAGIELDPHSHNLFWTLGWALTGLGRHTEAVEALRQATLTAPDDPMSQAHLGVMLGLAGNRPEALTILRDLERRRLQEYVSGFLMAQVSLVLGESDQAISWLQKSAEERDALLPYLDAWFILDPLRSDPRFQALLRRMNFPETTTTA